MDTGQTHTKGGTDRFRQAINAAQQDTAMTQIQKAPIPTIEEERQEQGNNEKTEKRITTTTEKGPLTSISEAATEALLQKQKPPQRAPHKSIYFEPEQQNKLRGLRSDLERVFERDINPQDIVRYLVERADVTMFGDFGKYLAKRDQLDGRKKRGK